MADNIAVTPGSGSTIAADDIGGVLHQRVKVGFGADGASSDVSSANPFPVHLASFATLPISGTVGALNAGGSLTAYQGGNPWLVTLATLPVVTNVTGYALEDGGNLDTIVTTLSQIKAKTDNLDVTLGSRLASGATLPITGTVSALNAGGSLTAFQGGNPWQVTMATLPITGSVTALNAGGSLTAYQGGGAWLTTLATLPVQASQVGTWTVQPGNTPNTVAWLVTMATLPVVTTVNVSNVGQGNSGSQAWLMTLATLPVVGDFTVSSVGQGNSGSQAWLMTLATLPVSIGTPSVLAAGGSLSAAQLGTWTVQPGNTPNTVGWLVTMASLSGRVDALNAGGSLSAFQGGSWTVLPGNTPNTTAWLVTQATLPITGTVAATQSGIWNVFSSLASGSNMIAGAQYLPTLASLSSMGHTNLKTDMFSNLMVNTNVPQPNTTRLNRFYTLASMASLMASPGAGRRLVVREMDYSGNATLTVKLVEDQGGTPVTVWGPHYFLPYAGFIKPQCYIPITANKSLGVDIQGTAFNATIDLRVETENV